MLARAPLPRAVNAVGDRIGLDYRIDRRFAARKYVEDSEKDTKMEYNQLKNTYYSLTESRTKKDDGSNVIVKRRTPRHPIKLNSRVRKSLYKLSNEEKQRLQYTTFEKVHELWQQYCEKVLSDNDPIGLFRMDLHGCKLKCTASNNPTLVGTQGIVVQETKNTFLVIKTTNRLVTIPKRESIFELEANKNVYRIQGCNMLFTTQTRSKVARKQQKNVSDI